jgi:hypothetical protein
MKYTNLLIQYKGGGYDGCYWEWNFFLFDAKGKFHNLMSTGYRGIKTVQQAKAILDKKPKKIFPYTFTLRKEFYKFNLKNPKKIKEFQAETNPRLVDVIGEKINSIYKKPIMWFECDECGDKVLLEGFSHSQYPRMFHNPHNYSGNGGIGVTQYGKICENCYLSHSCGYCGEFNEVEENNVDEAGHCKYCVA